MSGQDCEQLALNQVYIGKDGWAWYRNGPENEVSVCDLIRTAAEALEVDLPILSDDDLSDLVVDWLQYGAGEPEGILAVLYRALCAMAEVRARLAAYEDTGLGPEEITDLQRAWDMYGGELGISGILAENRELKEKRTPKCYSADVDGGCRYLVPDGDDEPIARCKRCPLCYVDKRRKPLEPNAPLTLEELREMDGEIAYCIPPNEWVKPTEFGLQFFGQSITLKWHEISHKYGKTWLAYRCKPEEGTV